MNTFCSGIPPTPLLSNSQCYNKAAKRCFRKWSTEKTSISRGGFFDRTHLSWPLQSWYKSIDVSAQSANSMISLNTGIMPDFTMTMTNAVNNLLCLQQAALVFTPCKIQVSTNRFNGEKILYFGYRKKFCLENLVTLSLTYPSAFYVICCGFSPLLIPLW